MNTPIWSHQPLADGRHIVYRVRERRNTRGEIAQRTLIAEPGLFSEALAIAMVKNLNDYNGEQQS